MEIQGFDTVGPFLISLVRHHDERGFFTEIFNESMAEQMRLPKFVQENMSTSAKGVIRGLHWQTEPMAQGKLVCCLSGSIVDYFVDIRSSSPQFGKVFSVRLGADKTQWLWVPAGFAHGFESLEDETVVMYKVTNPWSKSHERSLSPLDDSLGIKFESADPILSLKDSEAPTLLNLDSDSLFD